jgi:hypothetical protein
MVPAHARLRSVVAAPSHLRPLALAASNFTDPQHERAIYIAAAGLAVLGVALLLGTVIWWRATKGEHSSLAPLEVMGQRTWQQAPHVEQVRRLEHARIRSEGELDELVIHHPDEIDLDELLRSFQPGFDDLRDPGVLVDAAADDVLESAEDAAEDAVAAGDEVFDVAADDPDLAADDPDPITARNRTSVDAVAVVPPSDELTIEDVPEDASAVDARADGVETPLAEPDDAGREGLVADHDAEASADADVDVDAPADLTEPADTEPADADRDELADGDVDGVAVGGGGAQRQGREIDPLLASGGLDN